MDEKGPGQGMERLADDGDGPDAPESTCGQMFGKMEASRADEGVVNVGGAFQGCKALEGSGQQNYQALDQQSVGGGL